MVLRREVARAVRYRQALALLLVEGPATTDALGRIRDAVRLCDTVLPAPEGSVAVLLPETPLQGALLVAERVAGAAGPGDPSRPPRSVGVASYPSQPATDAPGLLRAAARALESARSRGGGIMTSLSR